MIIKWGNITARFNRSAWMAFAAVVVWSASMDFVFAAGPDETAPATETQTELKPTVEQRLALLERKYENDRGASVASNCSLRISGVIQTDYRDYFGDHGGTQFTDQFLLRRVRPTFEGTLGKHIAFRITPDFANGGGVGTTGSPATGSALLPDAYVELHYIDAARARVGKMKTPVGFENSQGDSVRALNERSLANQLVSSRDSGAQIIGNFRNGQFGYQAAILNGQPDGATGEVDSDDSKDYAGRVFIQPFKPANSEWINGLGIGFAGSVGNQFGNAARSNLTSGYKTDGQQTFFTYQAGSFANGRRQRLDPHAYWYFSHVGFLGEFVSSSQQVRRVTTSTATATLNNQAWELEVTWVITGERPSFAGIKPRHAFNPKNKTWGAFEAVGRYAIFRADGEAFTQGFAAADSSARRAKSWASGLNWYLNNNLRVNSDYAVTSFTGGAAGNHDRPTEKVLLSRFQVTF
jgi:phosphate-selective porin OprO/OprP